MSNHIFKEGFTQNRELSWLKFNERVLMEAFDSRVPLLERLKFLSIFTSNLDEFFMIRVGSLFDMVSINESYIDNKSGLTPQGQLDKIYPAVLPLYKKREEIYSLVENELRMRGIYNLKINELEKTEQKFISTYFDTTIAPILSPQIIDTVHPFPHLQNKVLHIIANLKAKNEEIYGIIPVPSSLPPVVFLPGSEIRYITIEEILLSNVQKVFDMYTVSEKTVFSVIRNADISPDDETFADTDFRTVMKKVLHQRRKLAAVRLDLSCEVSSKMVTFLCKKLMLDKKQVYTTSVPMNLSYAFGLDKKLSVAEKRSLTTKPFTPAQSADIDENKSIMKQILKKDLLLSYPYQSMSPFLKMIKEAANNPDTISIKITIYRLASKTKLVEYLCAAAENGVDVTVLIELRARFDEQSNIDWSERLEESGCKIIYGFEEYKVHSKICLITFKENDQIKYITQVGTGNYNEKTAELYTDVSLITADNKIGVDATNFFKNMAIGNLDGNYSHLLVAPVSLKSTVLKLIDEQIALGSEGRITIKINSITDITIIEKLKDASVAGVKINLIVRGICCIVPNIEGKTENIKITNIVGRYLEHSRFYCFGSGENEKIYISSADYMTRNTTRRVEVACPIYDETIKDKIRYMIKLALTDNVKSRILQSDGNYITPKIAPPEINSQEVLMDKAYEDLAVLQESSKNKTTTEPVKKENSFKNFFRKIFK